MSPPTAKATYLPVTPLLPIDIDDEDSPPASPTQPAPPPASPCLVTGPSLAAPTVTGPSTPLGQSSASAEKSDFPPIAGDSPVNGILINGGTSTADDILVVKCGQCSTVNVISLAKDCWYVIFRGLGVGVQRDSEIVEQMTRGVPHALFKKYRTRAIAEDAFEQAKKRGFIQYLFR